MKPRCEIRFTRLKRTCSCWPQMTWLIKAIMRGSCWPWFRALADFFKHKPNTTANLFSIPLPVRSNVYKAKIQNRRTYPRRQQAENALPSDEWPGGGVFPLHSSPVPWWSGLWFTGSWMVLSKTSCLTRFFRTALQGDSQSPLAPSSI